MFIGMFLCTPTYAAPKDVPKLLKRILKDGQRAAIPAAISKAMDIPEVNRNWMLERKCHEGGTHHAYVVMNSSKTAPVALYMSANHVRENRKHVGNLFTVSPKGELLKMMTVIGQRDENDRPVKGASEVLYHDINLPEYKSEYEKELQAWFSPVRVAPKK
jgi:hypothetical protein